MKREELERLIVDASDGVLNTSEIRELEAKLQNHPDLYEDYLVIMKLPDLNSLYQRDTEVIQHRSSIQSIKQSIREISNRSDSFEMVTLDWFKRYALAASLAIFAVTSVFSFVQDQDSQNNSEELVEEYFYPDHESTTESYVLYYEGMTPE